MTAKIFPPERWETQLYQPQFCLFVSTYEISQVNNVRLKLPGRVDAVAGRWVGFASDQGLQDVTNLGRILAAKTLR